MKIKKLKQLNNFIAAVNDCEGAVWLISTKGDRYNLKSQFSQYIAWSALLTEQEGNLELFCSNPNDMARFYKFFYNSSEI